MGSIEEPPTVIGEYTQPVIGPTTAQSDPWKRNYFIPPPLDTWTPRRYPLTDVRPLLSQPDYSPLNLLESHGFGVVHHDSAFVAQLGDSLHEDAVTDIYNPELEKLVLDTLGAKKMFNLTTVFRQGARVPQEFKLPISLKSTSQATLGGQKTGDKANDKSIDDDPAALKASSHMPKLARSSPLRVPHRDSTPLGARQMIRLQAQDIYNIAEESGVLAAEDSICAAASVDPVTKKSNDAVAEQYNTNGQLGPRYAYFSIWRPLKKVYRDPITLAPRKESPEVSYGGDMVELQYHNRVPGFKGDFIREFAMLGVKEADTSAETKPVDVEWCYLSGQMPNEVLFIKLFDSASLGRDSLHAGAPWHASPEIFDAAGSDEPRESIECRVLVFW